MRAAETLSAVYHQIRPKLLRLLHARTRDAALAEDLVQELWVRLQKTELGTVANCEAYLYRMAMNLATDHARAQMQRVAREEDWADCALENQGGILRDSAPDAERLLLGREALARVMQALADMPPRAAHIFRLHRIEGLSHSEIAQQLAISRSAVEKSMAIALKYLLQALSDWGA